MVNVVKSNNEVEDTKNNVENKIHPGNKITPSTNEIIKGESTVTTSTSTLNHSPIPVAANNTQQL